VLECDATGALPAAAIAAAPDKALDRLVGGTVFAASLREQAQRRADEAILAAEFIRAGRGVPPPSPAVEPPPPPPPPDPALLEAYRKAGELATAERAARAKARGATTVGRSQAEIETELVVAAQRQRAEAAAATEAAATLSQRAAALKAARAEAQAEATALLKARAGEK
jgi:hypothetical protein